MDYARDVITKMAEHAIATHGGPTTARVFFKFTCSACGARCIFNQANRLFTEGECSECHAMTVVEKAGFALHFAPLGFPPGT